MVEVGIVDQRCEVVFLAPTAQALTISDGIGSIEVNSFNGGLGNFHVNGQDDLAQVIIFYRTSTMSQEAPISGRFANSVVTSVSQTAPDTITVLGSVTEFDYQLENDPRFLRRVESARKDLRAGRGVRLEDLPD